MSDGLPTPEQLTALPGVVTGTVTGRGRVANTLAILLVHVDQRHRRAVELPACAGYRVSPAAAAPAVSGSRPNASTGPSAPAPRRPPSSAVCAPQARIAAVKS